jgi:uncharacterized protein DUF3303
VGEVTLYRVRFEAHPGFQKEILMRFLMQVSMPLEKFNKAVLDGSAPEKIGRILDDAKPEAAYFFAVDEGKRGGVLIVNMNDTSEIPKFAEPWFLYFDATVKFSPVMTPQDLQKADLGKISAKWK